jgi:hypothetical protein
VGVGLTLWLTLLIHPAEGDVFLRRDKNKITGRKKQKRSEESIKAARPCV